MNCKECGYPTDYWKERIVYIENPVSKQQAAYHPRCAPFSDNMIAIREYYRLENPVVDKCLSLKEAHNLTFRETLELMVVSLVENNKCLHRLLRDKNSANPIIFSPENTSFSPEKNLYLDK